MTLSNRQKAEDYYERCRQFIKNRLADGNLSFSAEGKVLRSEIYEAIGVGRSVMSQNPRIKRLLGATERWARRRGITTDSSPQASGDAWRASGAGDKSTALMQARLNYLERQIAALMVENRELKISAKRADWLDKFLDAADGAQGALPW